MATTKVLTEAEANYIEECVSAVTSSGTLDCPCPRCRGALEIEITQSAYRVRCSNCELQMTVRGV